MELNVLNGLGLPVFITVAGIVNDNDDREGFVSTVLDLSEAKQAEQALIYRIGLEALIAEIASNLSNARPEQVNEVVLKTLAQLGRFLDVDRVYIFALFYPCGFFAGAKFVTPSMLLRIF